MNSELQSIQKSVKTLAASRADFIKNAGDLLGELESTCHAVEERASWVQQRLEEVKASDEQLVQRIATEIDRVAGGSDEKVEAMIRDLSDRLDQRAEAETEQQKTSDLKKQNARLAAELKLVKGRNAQLAETVESQQALIDKEDSLSSELSLLRKTLDTHRQLLRDLDSQPEVEDALLSEALAELDE